MRMSLIMSPEDLRYLQETYKQYLEFHGESPDVPANPLTLIWMGILCFISPPVWAT